MSAFTCVAMSVLGARFVMSEEDIYVEGPCEGDNVPSMGKSSNSSSSSSGCVGFCTSLAAGSSSALFLSLSWAWSLAVGGFWADMSVGYVRVPLSRSVIRLEIV